MREFINVIGVVIALLAAAILGSGAAVAFDKSVWESTDYLIIAISLGLLSQVLLSAAKKVYG